MRLLDRISLMFGLFTFLAVVAMFIYPHTPWALTGCT
jgi:hypothetical protein